jgi:hypothetical protein
MASANAVSVRSSRNGQRSDVGGLLCEAYGYASGGNSAAVPERLGRPFMGTQEVSVV